MTTNTSIANNRPLRAYAVIVDINNFASMVREAVSGCSRGELIAQFTSETLKGAISAIEDHEGHIVSVMGDAILGIVSKGQHIFKICAAIASTVNRACRHVSDRQRAFPSDWHYAPGGISLKICIEFGWMDVSTVTTRQSGEQKILIGPAINHASRIGQAGAGNRCLIGPAAARMKDFASHPMRGPFYIAGKDDEGDYGYYEVNLSHLWREGGCDDGRTTYRDDAARATLDVPPHA